MPLLALASKVVLLTIADHRIDDPLAGQMAGMLQANGIPAETVRGKGRALGQAWLDEAAALDADLPIKGGYTRNRLRQMIFGDATSHILTHAMLPVLMAS
jgi:nucleotide-binding universal stress UspA family protein